MQFHQVTKSNSNITTARAFLPHHALSVHMTRMGTIMVVSAAAVIADGMTMSARKVAIFVQVTPVNADEIIITRTLVKCYIFQTAAPLLR